MKVLIVGDSPSKLNKSPDVAFVGAASYPRLLEWLKRMDIVDYELTNSDTAGCRERIRAWSGPIIALGKEAQARTFGLGKKCVHLPHPSGLNRQINNVDFIEQQLAKARRDIENWGISGPKRIIKIP